MSSVSDCPVPQEQQPINEYQALQQSWFFKWGKLGLLAYSYKLFKIWAWGLLVSGPIATVSFPWQKDSLHFVLAASGGSMVFVALTIIYLYTGWSHVSRRLRAESVPYEESGWYDGQIWVKTAPVLARDRLLAIHEVQPTIRRIQRTFLAMGGAIALGSLFWQIDRIL
jgi:Conserved in the green lineage and diatoms 27